MLENNGGLFMIVLETLAEALAPLSHSPSEVRMRTQPLSHTMGTQHKLFVDRYIEGWKERLRTSGCTLQETVTLIDNFYVEGALSRVKPEFVRIRRDASGYHVAYAAPGDDGITRILYESPVEHSARQLLQSLYGTPTIIEKVKSMYLLGQLHFSLDAIQWITPQGTRPYGVFVTIHSGRGDVRSLAMLLEALGKSTEHFFTSSYHDMH